MMSYTERDAQASDQSLNAAGGSDEDTAKRVTPIENIPGYEMTERGPVIFGPSDGPLETPVESIGAGPLYMSVEEVDPELGPDAAKAAEARKGFEFNVDRRDFLRLFSVATAAGAAACVRRPVEKAIPYVNQPVDFIPGVANFYATTCGDCAAGCGLVIKTREGRPTKIEGNPKHPISLGGVCTLGQSSLQALYHPERRKAPAVRRGGDLVDSGWDDVYASLGEKLAGKKIGVFTNGATGHRHQFYREWLKAAGSSETNLYTYEANALYSTLTEAHKMAYGVEAMPRFDLRAAKLIVGIGSDFLDVGVSPVFMSKTFAGMHGYNDGKMGKFVQFESALTVTGGKSDFRHVIPPTSELVITLLLMKSLLEQTNVRGSANAKSIAEKILGANSAVLGGNVYEAINVPKEEFDALAKEILGTQSLVLAGSSHSFDAQATQLQMAAIVVNELSGAFGTTVILDRGWMTPPVAIGDLKRFVAEAAGLEVLIVIDSNPIFTVPASYGLGELLKKIPLVISMQSQPCETDQYAEYVLNIHHYLECWGDEQTVAGFWSARQPAVRSTSDSRQAEDAMLWLAAAMKKPMPYREYRDYIRQHWKGIQELAGAKVEFDLFFDAVLRMGFVPPKFAPRPIAGLADISNSVRAEALKAKGTLVLLAPLDLRFHDGRGANRPVLQEVGDAMTTIAWDSWVGLNPGAAKKLGFKRNDILVVETPAGSLQAALYPLPGLHPDSVVIHRGNGHESWVSKISGGNGINPLNLFTKAEDSGSGMPVTAGAVVKLSSTGKIFELATMQKSGDTGNRKDIAVRLSVNDAKALGTTKWAPDDVPNLYPDLYKDVEYRWGMAIDLTKCTGCGACVVACAQENNVAQVGREQVLLGREMHWIRRDRYFAGELDNPQVTIQPMMCQQCSHAPCEAVCPVFATTHEPEGINAMTYNRCIGTRYCANACPYKVRRFNWWTHKWNVIGVRLQDRNIRPLNPDVTVRTRGVMEKCNFCYHRLRDAKHKAKERGGRVQDGEVKVACEQTCPSDAIVFGNLKDPDSRVLQIRTDRRSYLALNGAPGTHPYGLKTLPNVSYGARISHAEPAGGSGNGGGGHSSPGHSEKSGEHHG